MLIKILKRFFARQNFWQNIGYSELNELYTSNFLRRISLSILMIFVPYYLYTNKYTIGAIFSLFGLFFISRTICDFLAGYTVARFGPKHTLIIAAFLQIITSALLLTVPTYHWSIFILGTFWGASASFYFLAFHVEFSKIKTIQHSGSEIGHMNVVERVGATLGPAIGGVLAYYFGPAVIFLVATILAILSLWPLFLTNEPTKTKQHLDFKGFPLHKAWRDIISYVGHSVENTLTVNLWPFYIALFIFSSSVYLQLGIISSISVLASIYSAHIIGKILDKQSGVNILRFSAVINSLIHLLRPFTSTLGPAYGISIANEVITNGYRIPYTKGFYAASDGFPGHRIVYIVAVEAISSIIKATIWFMLALGTIVLTSHNLFVAGFIIASIASLFIMTEKFKAIR